MLYTAWVFRSSALANAQFRLQDFSPDLDVCNGFLEILGRDVPILFYIADIDSKTQLWVAADTEYWSDNGQKIKNKIISFVIVIITYLNKKI